MKKFVSLLLILLLTASLAGQTKPGGTGKLGGTLRSSIPGAGTTLNTGLQSYWKMDETSGTRVDAQGGDDDLTDVNTVGFTTGIINNAANFFTLNGEQLTRADAASVSIGSGVSFSWVVWVRLGDKTASHAFVSKDNGSTQREYLIFYSSSFDRLRAFFQTTGGFAAANADVLGSPAINTTYFIAVTFDNTTNEIAISVNNGSATTGSTTGTGLDTTAQFEIGSGASASGNFMEGWIDEVGFWKKKLSGAEITELYNGGAGKTCCPFN